MASRPLRKLGSKRENLRRDYQNEDRYGKLGLSSKAASGMMRHAQQLIDQACFVGQARVVSIKKRDKNMKASNDIAQGSRLDGSEEANGIGRHGIIGLEMGVNQCDRVSRQSFPHPIQLHSSQVEHLAQPVFSHYSLHEEVNCNLCDAAVHLQASNQREAVRCPDAGSLAITATALTQPSSNVFNTDNLNTLVDQVAADFQAEVEAEDQSRPRQRSLSRIADQASPQLSSNSSVVEEVDGLVKQVAANFRAELEAEVQQRPTQKVIPRMINKETQTPQVTTVSSKHATIKAQQTRKAVVCACLIMFLLVVLVRTGHSAFTSACCAWLSPATLLLALN